MSRADEDLLARVHRRTAEELLKRLDSGEATAAELTAAINFLAKNDIKALPVKGSPLEALGASVEGKGISLPFEGDTPFHPTPQ